MAVDANGTRRQRAWDSIRDGASRTWSRRVRGSDYALTLSSPSIRALHGSLVFSVDVRVTKDGVLFFDDKINMPNPPQGIRNENGTFTDSPLQALRSTVLDVLRAMTNDFTTPHLMRDANGNLLGDTLAVRSSTADGRVESDGTTSWNTVRNGNSLSASSASNPETVEASDIGPGTEYQLSQIYLDFDTSTLGASASISAAVFTLYGNSSGTPEVDTDNYDMQIRPYNWGGTVSTADWIDVNPSTGWTNLTLMAHFDVGSWDAGSSNPNNFTTDSFADVSKTGVTYVVLGMSALGAGTGPTGVNTVPIRMADQAGTTSDPLLTVTYTIPITGTIAATLQKALFSGSGAKIYTGTIAATLQKATAALAGTHGAGFEGTVAATMKAVTASFVGVMQPTGTITSTLQEPMFAGAGVQTQTGAVAATLQEPTFAGSGAHVFTGTMAGTLQKVTFAGTGAQTQTGSIAATLQEQTAALVGVMQPSGVVSVTMRPATFTGAGTHQQIGAIAAALQAATFAGAGLKIYTGTIAGTLQYLTFEGIGVLAMPGFAIVLDSYADGMRLLDQYADGITLTDAYADGMKLFDLAADGITVDDDYSNGARLYDGRQ